MVLQLFSLQQMLYGLIAGNEVKKSEDCPELDCSIELYKRKLIPRMVLINILRDMIKDVVIKDIEQNYGYKNEPLIIRSKL